MNLLHYLQGKLHTALTGLVPDPAPYSIMLKMTQDARFGDYQANCAMSLNKVLGKPPLEIAQMIADAIARLLRFLGHTVISDNHLGDWGTQFGILLYGYKNHLDKEAFEKDPV